MNPRVLVVDDEPSIREALADALSELGLSVRLANDARAALGALEREVPDIVLANVRMPGLSGLDLLRRIRAQAPTVDVVMMTAFDDMPAVATAMREGAVEFLTKPLDLHQRVIAATHRNLEEMIASGAFREDLYYRLRVVEIRVPPLREREADVPVLLDHLASGGVPDGA